MLKNNLAAGLHLESKIIEEALQRAGIKPAVRAEELLLEDWQKLFAALPPFMVQ
jgi:16S rRNA A1518/A1519 N6-dimethyltransferase RsmA/KsgA/DIM1 with predicted DNA glycosylase/AP lyase activity